MTKTETDKATSTLPPLEHNRRLWKLAFVWWSQDESQEEMEEDYLSVGVSSFTPPSELDPDSIQGMEFYWRKTSDYEQPIAELYAGSAWIVPHLLPVLEYINTRLNNGAAVQPADVVAYLVSSGYEDLTTYRNDEEVEALAAAVAKLSHVRKLQFMEKLEEHGVQL